MQINGTHRPTSTSTHTSVHPSIHSTLHSHTCYHLSSQNKIKVNKVCSENVEM